MARYTPPGSLNSILAVNAELEKISEAFEDTVSRKNDSPNQMEGDLDLNGNSLLNVQSDPSNPGSLVTRGEVYTEEEVDSLLATSLQDSKDYTDVREANIRADFSEGITGATVVVYPDITSMEASEPTQTGQRAEVVELDSAQFVVADPGYTSELGDKTAANGRVWKLIPGKCVTLNMVGYTGAGNESVVFDTAVDVAIRNNVPLFLGPVTLLTDGSHNITSPVQIVSQGFTIKRATTGYTGTSPLLTVTANNVTIDGDITFDGNNPDESGVFADSYASLLVTGDNFTAGKVTCLNTPMPSEESKQLYGCKVTGDKFSCGEFYGEDSGYSALQLRVEKDLESFYCGRFNSVNHNYKGLSVGAGDGMSLTSLVVEDFKASTSSPTAHPASEGLLIDTSNDNSLIQIDSVRLGNCEITGGESNCLKIQNVDSFYCDNLLLNVNTTLGAGEAMRMHAKNCHVGKIQYNGERVRIYSLSSKFGEVSVAHDDAVTLPNVFTFEDNSGETELPGPRHHHIDEFEVQNNPTLTYLFSLNHSAGEELNLRILNLISNNTQPFGNFGGASGLEAIEDGRIRVDAVTGYEGDYIAGSAYSKWVQVGDRIFKGASAPTLGTYRVGDYVKNTNTVVVDPGGANYIDKGWICTAGGDESAFNFEVDRVLL